VIATQNPVEYEGTYPLPEAQLDRFLLKINVPLPTATRSSACCGAPPRLRPARPAAAGVQPVAAAADLAAGRAAAGGSR
jgi:MoxR-like ATPase